MNGADQRSEVPLLASSISKLLPPALMLVVLLVLAGFKAELDLVEIALLLVGIIGVPGLIYMLLKDPFRRRNIPDHFRVNLLLIFTLTGSAVCFLIPLAPPVPWTVAALFLGNASLVFFRRWLNVSGHVSVLTFVVLWIVAVFGHAWTWLLVLSPLMAVSRVSVREHTGREALAGALLGLATFLCFVVAMTWS
ncbi:hypothetical protein IWX65_002866 [Arthrobacter sp. CAN_A214]|uniref:hypothetical protein n=1 Tax=Arthrobacter sp. CAN_A214 TaxID=2787720 RepID=UPI0018C99C76